MLYRPIHTAADFHLLQTDIDKLCNWADNNLLKFNSRKCKYMIISRKIQPPLPGTPLTVNGSLLENVPRCLAYFFIELVYASVNCVQESETENWGNVS